MPWSWQLPDWSNFRFDADSIHGSEEQFLIAWHAMLMNGRRYVADVVR
jgi:hypothetical protein